jgi:hypothetical protein
MNEKLDLFIKENRKSFPKYFKVRELRKYNKNGQLYQIYFLTSLVGFYVLEEEKMKSLFIKKDYRTFSKEILADIFKHIKSTVDYCTLAVNEMSPRVKRLAIKNGFVATDKYVKGKTHKLRVYEWS